MAVLPPIGSCPNIKGPLYNSHCCYPAYATSWLYTVLLAIWLGEELPDTECFRKTTRCQRSGQFSCVYGVSHMANVPCFSEGAFYW